MAKARARLGVTLIIACAMATGGLTEIDVNAAIVYEHVVHLEIGALARRLIGKLDKTKAQAVASDVVLDDLTAQHAPELREEKLQVLLLGDGIKLADEQHILGGCLALFVNVTQHDQNLLVGARLLQSLVLGDLLFTLTLHLMKGRAVVEAAAGQGRGRRTAGGDHKARRVGKGIVQEVGVANANDAEGMVLAVAVGVV